MRVVALFRVSTDKQETEGASLDAQQRRYRELAAIHNWSTVAEFRGCESAVQAATERQVLQQVLACIREDEPDALWVYEQSRLTRGDELEVAVLFRELREREVNIIVGGIVRDLSTIDERFMVGIQSLVDRAEAERIRERMMRGKRERARQGKKNSGFAPFGYMNPPKGDPERGTLRIVPEEATVIRKIFELAAAGNSSRGICHDLNATGVHAPRGTTWGKTTVRRIVDNPAYIGWHCTNVWVTKKGIRSFRLDLNNEDAIVVEAAHEPIISRELWDAVHARPRVPTYKPTMLTGLLWVNGLRYCGDTSHGVSVYRDRAKGHSNPWLGLETTDTTIWKAFVSLAKKPDFVAALIVETQERRSTTEINADIEEYERRITKYQKRSARLIDMRADGEISKATFAEKGRTNKTAIAHTESQVRKLRAELVATDVIHGERVVKAVRTLVEGRRKLTSEQKRQILRSILQRVDATVERTNHSQVRNQLGHYGSRTGPRWGLKDVFFNLAVPMPSTVNDGNGSLTSSYS